MSSKNDWLIARELEEIAAALRAIGQLSEDVISFGEISVTDVNGEALGFIESVQYEARFVPVGWRHDSQD